MSKVQAIVQNAENQVATMLKNKVEKFIASRTKENRIKYASEAGKLVNDLQAMISAQPNFNVFAKPPAQEPLPAREEGGRR